jgi:hypothetical protein
MSQTAVQTLTGRFAKLSITWPDRRSGTSSYKSGDELLIRPADPETVSISSRFAL